MDNIGYALSRSPFRDRSKQAHGQHVTLTVPLSNPDGAGYNTGYVAGGY